MVQTQLEQVSKSQRELLDEMNNNINDHVVRVMTRGGRMTQEPLYPEGHPKRIEQDSQRINIDAPTPTTREKPNSSAGDRATATALQLKVSSSVGLPALLLYPLSSSASCKRRYW